jgi:hypothetical protein
LTNEKYKGDALLQKCYRLIFWPKNEKRMKAKFHNIMWKIVTKQQYLLKFMI